jgi:hypothetical protein
VVVEGIFKAQTSYASGGATALKVYSAFANAIPSLIDVPAAVAGNVNSGRLNITTNTLAQILTQLVYGGAVSYSIETMGYYDTRGKYA